MARYLFINTSTDEQTIVEDTPPFDAADHLDPGTYTVAALSDDAADEVVVAEPIPVPANTVLPAITGVLTDGETVSLSTGTWSPAPDEIEREWLADGVAVGSVATLDLTGREGDTISARTRARMTGGAWSGWATATGGGLVAEAPEGPAFTARFGVGQGAGVGAFNTAYYTSTPPADGTYGPFTVSGGIITPNTTLVAGSYDVGGYPVEVLAGWLAFGTLAEFTAAGSAGGYGKTCLVREGIRGTFNNNTSGFLRRQDGQGTIILGDGPDVRLTAHDPAYDARAHFASFAFDSVRNVTWRNLRFAPTTKTTCWHSLRRFAGTITTGNLWVDKCVGIASRPDPHGNYTAGTSSFPGNYGFYTVEALDGLRVTDSICIGGHIGFQLRPALWGELVGNAVYLSYSDAYKIQLDPAAPVLFAANIGALTLALSSDAAGPHPDCLQLLGGPSPANTVIEASAHFSGDCRGHGYSQPFFLSDSTGGYQALMRDCVSSGAEIYPFTVSTSLGSTIEHCAWSPYTTNSLPANTTGGIRFGNVAPPTGINALRNSVFRGVGAGTIDGGVSKTGNVEVQNWVEADLLAQYEDWTIGGVTYPTLQQVMAGLKSKSGVAGHRVSFTGPDASSFQIAGLTAPILTGLTVTSTTAASAAATITTDTDLNPIFWAVVPVGTSVANVRDIKRRLITGAVLYGWADVKGGDTAIALNLTGALVAGTTYDVVAMQENGWTRVSSVSRQSFTAT